MLYALAFIFPFTPIFLAFAYRFRGMAHSWGDTVNRIISWALPVGIVSSAICFAWGLPIWLGALCAVGAFIAATIGHASDQGDTMAEHEGMAIITVLMLFIMLFPFYAYFIVEHTVHQHVLFIYVLPISLLSGFAYWQGYKMKGRLSFWGVKWCVPGDTSWGELFTGGSAFGIAYMILGITGVIQRITSLPSYGVM